MTPNYNDGKFHSWNGGECPVHPESVVECVCLNGPHKSPIQSVSVCIRSAESFDWDGSLDDASLAVGAFRVITPYAEPAPDPVKPAKRDLRTIDEPFYRLDKKTQGRLRKADAKGFPLQTKGLTHDGSTGAEWGPISKNGWYRDETVRLDPTFTPPAKRVKSKPACATITQTMWRSENGCLYGFRPKNGVPVTITFTRTNGVIDNDSYKVEVKE